MNERTNGPDDKGYRLDVPGELLRQVPTDVREDDAELDRYLHCALKVGLQALGQAGVHLDYDVVNRGFAELYDGFDQLFREMGDDDRATSIPHRVRRLLEECFGDKNSAFNQTLDLANPNSPLKRLADIQRNSIGELRSELRKWFIDMGWKEELREVFDNSSHKGRPFESLVAEAINAVKQNGDRVDVIGDALAEGNRKKVGDVLIEVYQKGLPEDRIVIEAKSGGYSMKGDDGLLSQLDAAMQRRNASAAIGVVTLHEKNERHKRQRIFERHGPNKIVVVVDPDDDDGFLPLEVAYSYLREEVVARQLADRVWDREALESAIDGIESALNKVQRAKGNCTTAINTIKSVREDVSDMAQDIREQLSQLKVVRKPS